VHLAGSLSRFTHDEKLSLRKAALVRLGAGFIFGLKVDRSLDSDVLRSWLTESAV
jgi:hypothetical protein